MKNSASATSSTRMMSSIDDATTWFGRSLAVELESFATTRSRSTAAVLVPVAVLPESSAATTGAVRLRRSLDNNERFSCAMNARTQSMGCRHQNGVDRSGPLPVRQRRRPARDEDHTTRAAPAIADTEMSDAHGLAKNRFKPFRTPPVQAAHETRDVPPI